MAVSETLYDRLRRLAVEDPRTRTEGFSGGVRGEQQ